MDKGNQKKYDQLGMPHATAQNRLRKMITFSLVQETGRDVCYRCGGVIETALELSIEHKEPWLDNDIERFWDLGNIAFAHLSCNVAAARKSTVRPVTEGYSYCTLCKEEKPVNMFAPSHVKGSKACRDCNNIKSRRSKQKRKKIMVSVV